MHISDIRNTKKELLELIVKDKFKLKERVHFSLINLNNQYYLQTGSDALCQIEAADSKNQDKLSLLLSRNLPYIIDVVSYNDQKKKVYIEVYSFPRMLPIDFDILIQDNIIQACQKNDKKLDNKELCLGWLKRDTIISFDKEQTGYLFIGLPSVIDNEKPNFDNLVIRGRSTLICVSKKKDANDNYYFSADKLSKDLKVDNFVFYPAYGVHNYVDNTQATVIKQETLAILAEIGSSLEGYLNTWQEYGKVEQQFVFNKAKRAGLLYFDFVQASSRGYKLNISPQDKAKISNFIEECKSASSSVEISPILPEFLLAEKPSIEDYTDFKKESKKNGFFIEATISNNFKNDSIDIEIKQELETEFKSGYVYLGLNGDMNRFSRREESRNLILQGLCPMPHLAAILEGKSVTTSKPTNHAAISPLVNSEIFTKNPPTVRQKEAIELALNTPDVCIIQGPPGTGKTTVITAILKRLNEMTGATGQIKGRNLISAYQHDAVQNAVERIEIYGLPAIKFGRKSTENTDNNIINSKINQWCDEILEKLEPAYQNIKSNYKFSDFYKLKEGYLLSPLTAEQTAELLSQVVKLANGKISADTFKELERNRNELLLESASVNDSDRIELLKTIRRIPTCKAAFFDGGLNNIKTAAYRLEEKFPDQFKEEIVKLKKFCTNQSSDDERTYLYLKKIQKEILLKLIPKQIPFLKPKSRNSIEILLSKINDELSEYEKTLLNNEDKVLFDYYSTIEDNPFEVQEAIFEYTAVAGATCQQAVGGGINDFKSGKATDKKKRKNPVYENVLIDEAARSNPLDLFIPMSLAEKRIIMVGDHRQLPHMVEEDILKELEGQLSEQENLEDLKDKINRNIKESLFEHLFKGIKELEKKDGIKRTVTLDEQYRTHPVLGKFVSESFYEKNGESEIKSGLPAEFFKHNLPGIENKAVIWLDVPNSDGCEGKNGTSRIRRSEAERIADHLSTMFQAPQSKGLNFGIITFYSAQVEEIKIALKNYGITHITDNGLEISDDFKTEKVGHKTIEKLRIGTVDAFQGMEFDFVYLSMVRSNNLPDNSEKQKRSKYGHLMSDNRLCVSMSRQKKALICVGDSGMLKSSNAKQAVGALFDYYKLCKESEYGCII